MKKWAIALTAAVLTATLLTGCQPAFQPTYPEGVTKEKLEEISAARSVPMSWYHIDGYGSYYLASENGYDIFYELGIAEPRIDVEDVEKDLVKKFTCEIGSASFYPCWSVYLWAYKDGEILLLDRCYEEGLISDAAILKAQESFDEYMQILKDMEHDVYWQRQKRFLKEHNKEAMELDKSFAAYVNGSKSNQWTYFQQLFAFIE